MSSISSCCLPTCCPTTATTQIPGVDGLPGAPGSNGTNGINAFTLTTAQFTVPPDTTTPVTVSVANSTWMVLGQQIIIGQGLGVALANPGPGTFKITAIPSASAITLLWLQGANDVAAGTAISSGAVVSPSGYPALPLTIANGGTGAITKAAAQTALGLGQDPVSSTSAALAQAITAVTTQVGTVDVTIPAAGTWLIQGSVTVEWTGVTFAASRNITVTVRNVTQGTNVTTYIRKTGIQTTATFPDSDFPIPPISYAAGVAADHLQLQIAIDVINSAGTLTVLAGTLTITPLRKS